MTTRQIAEVERMNRLGLNDHIIAEALDLPQNTVWYCRNNLGLPVNKGQRRPRYTVYDGKTGQYLFEGTSRECADWMGIQQRLQEPDEFGAKAALFGV